MTMAQVLSRLCEPNSPKPYCHHPQATLPLSTRELRPYLKREFLRDAVPLLYF